MRFYLLKFRWSFLFYLMYMPMVFAQGERIDVLIDNIELRDRPDLVVQNYQEKMASLKNPPVPDDYPIHIIIKFKDQYPIRGASNIKRQLEKSGFVPIDVATNSAEFSKSHELVFAPILIPNYVAQKTLKQKRAFLKTLPIIKKATINKQLKQINKLLDNQNIVNVRSFVQNNLAMLRAARNKLPKLADFENVYIATFSSSAEYPSEFIRKLKLNSIIATAYVAPFPQNADILPTTESFQDQQGYLDAIGVSLPWQISGGTGQGITIADIEFAWQLDHEDLPDAKFTDFGFGLVAEVIDADYKSHGTSVLGEMVALNDGSGITGIAHGSDFGVVSVARSSKFYSVSSAILAAISHLDPGDIILIEQHAPDFITFNGSNDGTPCDRDCGCDQHRYLPMEFWQLEFDAIRLATQLGILVVEAAGNGSQNLDHANFGGKFLRDSGAILVGAAGDSRLLNNRVPTCFTNYGSALDLQAWGTGIMTLGGKSTHSDSAVIKAGDDDDRRQWYFNNFGGTSGASPIVAGAAALLQGIKKQRDQLPLSPNTLRQLLIDTGTPQAVSPKNIGPQPNLGRAAIILGEAPIPDPLVGTSCTTPAIISDECNGNTCRQIREYVGPLEECWFFGLFCDSTGVLSITDEYICVEQVTQ